MRKLCMSCGIREGVFENNGSMMGWLCESCATFHNSNLGWGFYTCSSEEATQKIFERQAYERGERPYSDQLESAKAEVAKLEKLIK